MIIIKDNLIRSVGYGRLGFGVPIRTSVYGSSEILCYVID